ncbi:MAG: tRNA uridine-5-carboxymethylaminomethyl(34) synthesis GTPase MnmE [Flavobacteriales bacterium]
MNYADNRTKTICALSTAPGMGAIALIRISGSEAMQKIAPLFSKDLTKISPNKTVYGTLKNGNTLLDDVVLTVFKAPHSFTGEDVIEIACHGSTYIQKEIINLLVENGIALAKPGEFTMRAFFNRKMDLSQAEAVADLIASDSEAAHKIAMHQMRGGFSKEISRLREELIHFASLVELELDFAEEDVEFADRSQLTSLIDEIVSLVEKLKDSFALGNVIKNGVPVAIAGVPNVGKSTLLNVLLNDNRAIVSEIPGTTRDTIEDEVVLQGVRYRFIDTAGIRETTDQVEGMGIKRSFEKIKQAEIVLLVLDGVDIIKNKKPEALIFFEKVTNFSHGKVIVVVNKIDACELNTDDLDSLFAEYPNRVYLSAKEDKNIDQLIELLSSFHQKINQGDIIITNARHHEALSLALNSLKSVQSGMLNQIPGDLLAIDIHQSLHHLGSITGEITTDDLLGNIFSKFCIGK